MLSDLLDGLFGCWHTNRSFPITVRGKRRTGAASVTGTYVVCLDCGKEFPYDWNQMTVLSGKPESGGAIAAVESTRATKAA